MSATSPKYCPGPSVARSSPWTVTAASPSPMMKKPTPPEPSVATGGPASNVRSLNDCASVCSSRPSRSENSGIFFRSSTGAATGAILFRRRASWLRLLRLGLLRKLLDPALRGVEAGAAELVELLAALPEGDCLLERHLAAL